VNALNGDGGFSIEDGKVESDRTTKYNFHVFMRTNGLNKKISFGLIHIKK
jgi:hypothetical protein